MAVLRRTPTTSLTTITTILAAAIAVLSVSAGDTNGVYSPCLDTTVARSDGFTFAIAFAAQNSFFSNNTLQLSPCDTRLHLSNANSQIAVFRPKVDEISLLTVNSSSFFPVSSLSLSRVSVRLGFLVSDSDSLGLEIACVVYNWTFNFELIW
jgi:hypothetical protein